jgi:hypothetical protein
MDSQNTIALLAGGLMLTLAASLGDLARRRAPLAWHAYLPWHAMIFAGIAAALFAAVHLYGLARAEAI